MKDFKVGDIVCHIRFGKGKIIFIENAIYGHSGSYVIRFYKKNSWLHSAGGRCEMGYGYYASGVDLTLISSSENIENHIPYEDRVI